MADDRKLERLENRNDELLSRIQRIERSLSERERFWRKVSDRAFVVGTMAVTSVAAVMVAARRER
ncbi:MAG TPA: hypothetical protein VN671_10735 [Solirubrobacterales bacterium]|nr:hypothetical protein [Solirubrobacterales bacterium]